MKTKLNFVIAFLSVFYFMSCTQDKMENISNETTQVVERPYNALKIKQVVAMLEHYDETRKPVLENALGFEDTRINHYSIEMLENYIAYVKQLSKEKGIKLTGLSFVSAAYPKNFDHGTENYQTFVYMPTTEINGKNIPFDAEESTSEKIVTMKETLANYGYNWVYDSKEDYESRDEISKKIQQNKLLRKESSDANSSTGNWGHLEPPYDDE